MPSIDVDRFPVNIVKGIGDKAVVVIVCNNMLYTTKYRGENGKRCW